MTRKELKKLLDDIIESANKHLYLFEQQETDVFNKETIEAVDKQLREALDNPDLRFHYTVGDDKEFRGAKIHSYEIDYKINGTILETTVTAQCELYPETMVIEFTLPEKK